MLVIFISLLSAALNYVSPLLVHAIITFLQSEDENSTTADGLLLVAGLVGT